MPDTIAIERARHGSSVGQPLTRRDGFLKVTGGARYAADNHPNGLLHAAMAVASVASGKVAHLDVAAAKAHAGVVEVMTPDNVPKLAISPDEKPDPFAFRIEVLQNADVRYAHQPIAVVILTLRNLLLVALLAWTVVRVARLTPPARRSVSVPTIASPV